jgi:hypothetical protein
MIIGSNFSVIFCHLALTGHDHTHTYAQYYLEYVLE